MVNEKLGFDVMSVLINARSCAELDEAIRVVNFAYPVLRGHLEVLEVGQSGVVEKDHTG